MKLFYLGLVNTKSLHCSKLGWLTLLLCMLCLSNCQIQKRLYRPGWNVDMGRSHATTPIKPTSDTQEKSLHRGLAENAHEDVPNGHSVAAKAEHTKGAEDFKTIQPSMLKNKVRENRGASGRSRKIQSEVQMRGQRLMHPKASLSFLLGLIAMGCVIFPIVVSGLGAAVILGLLVLLVVSALLAQKLSRIALEDIYMARSRYAGKALATAALIMSILALVALLGILIIALLGVAFLSLI